MWPGRSLEVEWWWSGGGLTVNSIVGRDSDRGEHRGLSNGSRQRLPVGAAVGGVPKTTNVASARSPDLVFANVAHCHQGNAPRRVLLVVVVEYAKLPSVLVAPAVVDPGPLGRRNLKSGPQR